ncbi:MAG: MFS transporter [Acidobacteria bacterium]|nr:MAG: MFS transporter [Acidobacteriota bacterium]
MALWSWALYDFANSAFTTLVVTFIYSTWFTKAMATTEARGTALWGRGIAVSSILIALLAPAVGAAADRRARRRLYLSGLTAGTILATALLAFVPPPHALVALALFCAANVLYELALSLYNGFLPGLAPDGRGAGRLSGLAWGFGYVGGLLCLVVGLVMVKLPWLDGPGGFKYRATNLLVAGWYLVFALPALLFLPEPAPPDPEATWKVSRIAGTVARLARYRQALRLLVARLIYNDGIVAVFSFGGIYAANEFGFSFEEILWFGITLNVAAGAGSFLFAFVDERFGGRVTVLTTLAGLTAATALAVVADSKAALWVAGVAIGLLVGPNQSASRSLMSRFVPRSAAGEFFGLYAFSGKLTSFAAPLLLSQLTGWTGSHRIGVASVIAFFAAGGLLLWRVDEEEGRNFAVRCQAEFERAAADPLTSRR